MFNFSKSKYWLAFLVFYDGKMNIFRFLNENTIIFIWYLCIQQLFERCTLFIYIVANKYVLKFEKERLFNSISSSALQCI